MCQGPEVSHRWQDAGLDCRQLWQVLGRFGQRESAQMGKLSSSHLTFYYSGK